MSKPISHQEEVELLKRIADHTPNMIYRMALPAGNYEYVSLGSLRIFEEPPETWYATPKKIAELIHPEWHHFFEKEWSKLLAGEMPPTYEYQIITKAGETKWVSQSNVLITDEKGKPDAIEGIVTDITQSKLAEDLLQKSNDRFKDLAKSMSDWIWEVDTNAVYTYCSEGVEAVMGYRADEMIGKTPFDFMAPEDAEVVSALFVDIVKHKKPIRDLENWNLSKEGKHVCLLTSGRPILGERGELLGYRGVDKDITKEKNTDYFSRKTAEIFEMVASGVAVEKVYDAICLMQERQNPRMRTSILRLKGDQLFHCSSPSLPDPYSQAIDGVKIGPCVGSCGTAVFLGKEVIVEDIATDPLWADFKELALSHDLHACWSSPIMGTDGAVLGSFAEYFDRPTTPSENELKEIKNMSGLVAIVMEREQRESNLRKLSQAIEQAGESVIITDIEGTIEYVNPSFTRMTGYTAEEVMGENPRILKSGKQPDAYYQELWDTITSGRVFNSKIVDRRKDGSLYPAIMSIAPIMNENGVITHYVGIQQDMTEHELLEEQFRQSQKMEALGTLVGGIAHDFNNMLAGMTGNLYLAKQALKGRYDVLEKLSNVEKLSFRAADMVQQLLTFARKDRVTMNEIPFNAFVKETIKLLHASVPENIKLEDDICDEVLQIKGDRTQVHQVLLNLLNNACDALVDQAEPSICIRLQSIQADEAFIEKNMGFATGAYARLSVRDNGCGFSAQMKEHLFEPFFTTKEVGKGTGLGLAMVFGAVKSHHGYIEVESAENKGSTFHIYLPLVGEKNSNASSHQQDGETEKGQGETILMVDDQAGIVDTGKEVLESMGYQVITAANGQEAVDVFKAHAKDIDLIIMDIVMPVMSGDKAADLIRQIKPNIKIIFSTGYDRDAQLEMDHELVISKPFALDKLSTLIRQIMGDV